MANPTENTKPRVVSETDPTPNDTPRHPNGMTDDQVRYALAAIGRRKNDPGYLKRGEEGAKEARRKINEEYLREMDEQENK